MSVLSLIAVRNPRIQRLWDRWGAHAPSIALLFGFIFDLFLFQRPDHPLENTLIIAHLALAGFGIILLNAKGKEAQLARIPLLLLVQFNFGALIKSLVVLYAKSGTLEGNLIFFFVCAMFVIGNEFAVRRYEELRFHVAAFYFLVLLYAALIVPIIIGQIGTIVFIISVASSACVIAAFIALLRVSLPKSLKGQIAGISLWVATIAIIFSGMYAFDLIPPVPLSMTALGVYHSVVRDGDTYHVTYEKAPWYDIWHDTSSTFTGGATAASYCFSSVFAPNGLDTPVVHVWERRDQSRDDWVEDFRISFPISGGRDNGYRGYSEKVAPSVGQWRCTVETVRGQVLGRMVIDVVPGTPLLSTTDL